MGGTVYSRPGTIGLRLEWGSGFENSKEISVSSDSYSFGVSLPGNTRFRVVDTSAPAGWGCKGKQTDKYTSNDSATGTHVYCGSTTSSGVRLASWNLTWYDLDDPPGKKQAIADLINQFNFDVMILNEVLDAPAVQDLISNYLGNASNWDFRITDSGCSLRQVTLWRKSEVTLQSGYELNAANSGGFIDEGGDTWRDCIGRRPYVATFAVSNSNVTFTTASLHLKAGSARGDCRVRRDQVSSFVQWVNWSGMNTQDFVALGDFNDELPGNGICNGVDTLEPMENHSGFTFATAQPGYLYSHMMGFGLVTFDTKSFQSSIDHIWASNSLFNRLETTVDTYGNRANAVQANMWFNTSWGEPDHSPPYVVIAR